MQVQDVTLFNVAKGERKMARIGFTSSIEETVSNRFREECRKRDIKPGIVLELFMKQFNNNQFIIKVTEEGMFLEFKEK